VSAIVNHRTFRRPHDLACNGFNLGRRTVLVILALNGKKGAGDMRQVFLYIPIPEIRGQSDVGPASEHQLRVIFVKFA
jgi:hypothetical protein